jgi:hypothetical protein
MSDQAVRCVHVHLGWAPGGCLCLEPSTKRVFKSAHCRFVEKATPGLTMHPQGWEEVVPDMLTNSTRLLRVRPTVCQLTMSIAARCSTGSSQGLSVNQSAAALRASSTQWLTGRLCRRRCRRLQCQCVLRRLPLRRCSGRCGGRATTSVLGPP